MTWLIITRFAHFIPGTDSHLLGQKHFFMHTACLFCHSCVTVTCLEMGCSYLPYPYNVISFIKAHFSPATAYILCNRSGGVMQSMWGGFILVTNLSKTATWKTSPMPIVTIAFFCLLGFLFWCVQSRPFNTCESARTCRVKLTSTSCAHNTFCFCQGSNFLDVLLSQPLSPSAARLI